MKNKTNQLPKNIELYRAKLSCKIGRDVLDGTINPPHETSRLEYAMFSLLHAIEDIAIAMEKETEKNK